MQRHETPTKKTALTIRHSELPTQHSTHHSTQSRICQTFSFKILRSAFQRSRKSAIKLLLFIFALLIFSTVLLHFYLIWGIDQDAGGQKVFYTENGQKIIFERFRSEKSCDQDSRPILEHERRIFQSVRKEHIELLEKFDQASSNLESITKAIPIKEAELRELELQIEELKLLQKELNDRRNVRLSLPRKPLHPEIGQEEEKWEKNFPTEFKSLDDAIDFSLCSISTLFRIYVYEPTREFKSSSAANLFQELSINRARTQDPTKACLFFAIFEPASIEGSNKFEKFVGSLRHWGALGRNHVVLILSNESQLDVKEVLSLRNASIVVGPSIGAETFRPSMDIAAHLNIPGHDLYEYQRLPKLLPHSRPHLLSFISTSGSLSSRVKTDLKAIEQSIISSHDSFLLEIGCGVANVTNASDLCFDEEKRVSLMKKSSFSLLFPNSNTFQQRFYESLLAGSVPVIAASDHPLPFQDLIDWRLAVFKVPRGRFGSELHFMLRSMSMADLLEMRRMARFYLENYLLNTKVLSQTILSALRFRLQMPSSDSHPGTVTNTFVSKNFTFTPLVGVTKPPYDDEYLGPVEASLSSQDYAHNFTSFNMYSYKQWNQLPYHISGSPHFLEQDAMLPSDAEFSEETSLGMRPISPGSGQEFALALGGNRPREQFTIVMTTYNRDSILMASLERLYKLPYLNKVIVVWNNVDRPPSGQWPRLHVPVIFVNATKNSLNNRFLPFDQIETEAVLSLDDDIDLRQHEIIFAFRVWREQRHRIVGFPARHHARYGSEMHYNSNHTCQLSMILTGAAFIHKSYFHAYSNWMPAIIRQKVDDWMNCEDLAMNFLVSHLTRQPPIKTTSRWTLRCPTCSEMLSQDAEHFNERHECIRFFTQVYGYNPLLFSQFRADSVLFKTRVPPNHQKCFRYV